jgi:hypothetical protein
VSSKIDEVAEMGNETELDAIVLPDLPARARKVGGIALNDAGRNVAAMVRQWEQYEHAEELVATLATDSQIVTSLMARWDITSRQANALRRAVIVMLQRKGQHETRDERMARYRLALEVQHRKADEEGDRRAAIAALATLAKLEGDAGPAKLPAGGGGQVVDAQGRLVPSEMTDAELEARARG